MSREPKDQTPVVFRVEKGGRLKRDVTAVFFRDRPNPQSPNLVSCYSHVGQHSSCSMLWYRGTRPAKPSEYETLRRELESAPYRYDLRVYRRIPNERKRDVPSRPKITRTRLGWYAVRVSKAGDSDLRLGRNSMLHLMDTVGYHGKGGAFLCQLSIINAEIARRIPQK